MSKFKSLLNWLKNPKMWFVILYLILSIALITASIVVVSPAEICRLCNFGFGLHPCILPVQGQRS